MLGGDHAEVGGLDPQGGVVRQHRRRAPLGLTERGADDPVVRVRRVEPMLDEAVLLDAVDLDLQRARSDRHRLGERAAVADAQVLDRPQRGTCRPADVVEPVLEAVELLDHGEWHDEVDIGERADARGIGDQHGRVEDGSPPDATRSPSPETE